MPIFATSNAMGSIGTAREGEAYSAVEDEADGKAFVERGRDDRHQFRFIVAPEDSNEMADLRSFTRDLMRQMEKDLETRLDWIAIDHYNTGHPHTHIIVRGVLEEVVSSISPEIISPTASSSRFRTGDAGARTPERARTSGQVED